MFSCFSALFFTYGLPGPRIASGKHLYRTRVCDWIAREVFPLCVHDQGIDVRDGGIAWIEKLGNCRASPEDPRLSREQYHKKS